GRRLLDRLFRRRLLSDDRCGRRRHRRGFEGGWQGGGGRRDSAGLDRIVCAWIGDGGCRGSGDWRHLDLGLLLGVEQGGEQRADQDGQGGGNQQDGPVAAGFGAGRSWLGGGTEAAVQQALGFLVEACRYALSLIVDGPHFGGSQQAHAEDAGRIETLGQVIDGLLLGEWLQRHEVQLVRLQRCAEP